MCVEPATYTVVNAVTMIWFPGVTMDCPFQNRYHSLNNVFSLVSNEGYPVSPPAVRYDFTQRE